MNASLTGYLPIFRSRREWSSAIGTSWREQPFPGRRMGLGEQAALCAKVTHDQIFWETDLSRAKLFFYRTEEMYQWLVGLDTHEHWRGIGTPLMNARTL